MALKGTVLCMLRTDMILCSARFEDDFSFSFLFFFKGAGFRACLESEKGWTDYSLHYCIPYLCYRDIVSGKECWFLVAKYPLQSFWRSDPGFSIAAQLGQRD